MQNVDEQIDPSAIKDIAEAAGAWRGERLENAQQDIYRLLAYATEQGRQIAPEVLRAAVDIARIAPSRMTEDQEESLWRIRGSLSERVQPAQASGLRLMELLESQTATREPRTLRGWSGRWLLVAILVVASAHVYALVGGKLLDSGFDKINRAGGLSEALNQGPRRFAALVSAPSIAAMQAMPGIAAAPTSGSSSTGPDPSTTNDPDGLVEKMIRKLDVQRERLEEWNLVWRSLLLPIRTPSAQASLTSPALSPELADVPSPIDLETREAQRMHALSRYLEETAINPLESEQSAADLSHAVLMEYVLPMLYGALGAFVFVVRLVTSDIDRGSLRVLLNIRYRIRLLLGAVFGLTIAMLTTENTPFMKSVPLSAVALAFLAGYGVDTAFGFLDGIISRARNFGLRGGDSSPATGH